MANMGQKESRIAVFTVILLVFCSSILTLFSFNSCYTYSTSSIRQKTVPVFSYPKYDVQLKKYNNKSLLLKDSNNKDVSQNHSVYNRTTEHDNVKEQNSVIKTLVIILGYQRGGSTFLGEIFNAHPAVFYSYEPLKWIQVDQLLPTKGYRRSDISVWKGRELIRKMVACNYEQLSGYFRHHLRAATVSLFQSRAVARKFYCDNDIEEERQRKCKAKMSKISLKTMEELCTNYRFHVLKVLRLHAIDLIQLLDLPGYKVKIIYLMRDPRGLLNSRAHVFWGITLNKSSTFPKEICFDMLENLEGARSKELPPGAIKFVKYEDVADNVTAKTKEMFDFVGLPYHNDVDKYLKSHALGLGTQKSGREGKITTYRRNSSQTAHAWSEQLTPELYVLIERQCGQYMSAAGYDTKYIKDVKEFQRLRGYQGEDMLYGRM